MADHIAFIGTDKDCEIATDVYPDSIAVRFTCEMYQKIWNAIPVNTKRWVDGAVDGLHQWPSPNTNYVAYISQFDNYAKIADPSFQLKPEKAVVKKFVNSVLDKCARLSPAWLSVPQLPHVTDSSRNKINRQLAEATSGWKSERNFTGRLILPIIITNQKQLNQKTERNKHVALASTCFGLAHADGFWVADSTLSDQEGSKTFEQLRFSGLIAFHTELNEAVGDAIKIAGPYWGMNLVLWARGLVDYPAIGLGNAYQYHLPGGIAKQPKTRVALSPLRRWAVANAQLKLWLDDTLKRLAKSDPAYADFSYVEKNFSKLLLDSRPQVAHSYKSWFDKIGAATPSGRAMALYQDLSSAYVVGKSLSELPKDEGTGRRPERVAKQLMLYCL